MQLVPLVEIERRWPDVERAVDRTPEIDRWCSGPDWVLPVHHGFGADAEPVVLATSAGREPGFALLARYQLPDDTVIMAGLEPLWGFACPLVGTDVEAVTAGAVGHLAGRSWDHLLLPGMPALDGPGSFTARVAVQLSALGPVGIAAGIVRRVADLSGGYDAWWSRRSSRFRRNLVQAGRRAATAGVRFVDVHADEQVFDRLTEIERQSWKGREESGMTSPEMARTYRIMVDRLQQRDRLRAVVARIDGTDVGFIMGGVRAGIYRGLQLSYVEQAGALSIGHLLQHHQLRALCQNRAAHTYDLGMDLDYKQRWADAAVPMFSLQVSRS